MQIYTKAEAQEVIRETLRALKMSAAQLARAAGIAPSTVTRALSPDSQFVPSMTTMGKIAAVIARRKNELEDRSLLVDQGLTLAQSRVLRSAHRVPIIDKIDSSNLSRIGYPNVEPKESISFAPLRNTIGDLLAFRLASPYYFAPCERPTFIITDQDIEEAKIGSIYVVRLLLRALVSSHYQYAMFECDEEAGTPSLRLADRKDPEKEVRISIGAFGDGADTEEGRVVGKVVAVVMDLQPVDA